MRRWRPSYNEGMDSVELYRRFHEGDDAAAGEIWERYAQRLAVMVRRRISPKLAQRVDPEDVLQSAYRSFFRKAESGKLLVEREGDLWGLLVRFTVNKTAKVVERNTAGKRELAREERDDALIAFASREPTPEQAAIAEEMVAQLMRSVGPDQRSAVKLRLQGHSLEEIAALLNRSERTIRRWLEDARRVLAQLSS